MAHFFPIRDALRYPVRGTRYGLGDKVHRAPNPPAGALIAFFLRDAIEPDGDKITGSSKAQDRVKIEIIDDGGTIIRTLKKVPTEAGVNRVAWDLTTDLPDIFRRDEEMEEWYGPPKGVAVLPGTYTVRLTVDDQVLEETVVVSVDPTVDVDNTALEAQFAVATELNQAFSAVNRAATGIDAVVKQLESRRANAE
ncbi:MAG: hypothetical protein P8127_17760, partial [Acidobacteriota bacterium]